jgi:nucleotide-binding universal stress UspA family protein
LLQNGLAHCLAPFLHAAHAVLNAARQLNEAAEVACQRAVMICSKPLAVIIQPAESHGCDLIIRASHDHKCMGALLRGGESQKVLTHCKIPVLVYR